MDEIKQTLSKVSLIANVQFVVITDLGATGAFDGVLENVIYILHIASPMNTLITDNYERDYFRPAIDNLTNILAAAAEAKFIKRIVITSSIGALLHVSQFATGQLKKEPYSSDDEVCHYDTKIQLPHPMLAYGASKSMALEAAESWITTNKPSFTVVYLLPTLVTGPNFLARTVASFATGSNGPLMQLILGQKSPVPSLGSSISIADMAALHLKALDPEVPAGRYMAAGGSMEWIDALRILEKAFPEEVGAGKKISLEGGVVTVPIGIHTEKTESIFGIKFKSFEEQVKSVAGYYLTLDA